MLRPSSALLAFVTLLATYAYFRNVHPNVNALSRFALVRALVEDRTTRIDRVRHLAGIDSARRDGHYYSDKAPGTSLLAAPAYALYHAWLRWQLGEVRARDLTVEASRTALYLCTIVAVALPTALAILFFFHLTAGLRGEAAALFAAAALGLGSLAFPYSTLFFSHQLSGAALFAAFGMLWWERRYAAAGPGGFRAARAALAGFLAGFAILTEYTAIVPATLLGLYLLWIAPRRALVPYVAGMLPPLAALMAYNWISFGGPLTTGYAFLRHPPFAEGVRQGLFGYTYPKPAVLARILVGADRGLLLLNPVLVLAVVGFRRMWAERGLRPEALLSAGVAAAYLLLNASFVFWDGGASLGPRFAVPMLSFLTLPLVFAIDERPALTLWTIVAILLLAISALNMLVGTAVYPLVPPPYDDALGYVYFLFFNPEAAAAWGAHNWGWALGLRGQATLLPVLGLWSAALFLFWRRPRGALTPPAARAGQPRPR